MVTSEEEEQGRGNIEFWRAKGTNFKYKTAYKNVLHNMGTKPLFYKNCKWAVKFKNFIIYIYIHTYIYVCIYIYTHTHTQEEKGKRNQYTVKEPGIRTKIKRLLPLGKMVSKVSKLKRVNT